MTLSDSPLNFLCIFALTVSCLGQTSKAEEDRPRAVIAEVIKLPDGGLLLAVRLYASRSATLVLSHPTSRRAVSLNKFEEDDSPFSLAASSLQDVYTGAIYTPLTSVPSKPFVGPMAVTTELNPGGWLQLGVAFPEIPKPPEKEGKKLPYQLIFQVPELKVETKIVLDAETLKPL